jgi:molybdate transport system ATP-binding protein
VITFSLSKALHAGDGPMHFHVEEQIPEGAFVALTGPSGAGKTTLLRMLAGLTEPDGGMIRVGEEAWYDGARKLSLATRRRGLGFVFQDAALFPHMSVRENLAYAAGRDHAGDVDALLAMAGLSALTGRAPATLSGGQRQRVALARALVRKPRLLLLDEPLSALDSDARRALQDLLAAYHAQHRMTVLMVSHDVREIVRLAGSILVMEAGRVASRPTPAEFPASVGGTFQCEGTILSIVPGEGAQLVVTLQVGDTSLRLEATPAATAGLKAGERVRATCAALDPIFRKL